MPPPARLTVPPMATPTPAAPAAPARPMAPPAAPTRPARPARPAATPATGAPAAPPRDPRVDARMDWERRLHRQRSDFAAGRPLTDPGPAPLGLLARPARIQPFMQPMSDKNKENLPPARLVAWENAQRQSTGIPTPPPSPAVPEYLGIALSMRTVGRGLDAGRVVLGAQTASRPGRPAARVEEHGTPTRLIRTGAPLAPHIPGHMTRRHNAPPVAEFQSETLDPGHANTPIPPRRQPVGMIRRVNRNRAT
ncbi:Protein of unknown function [Pyronema omphalodes CBS 100304]|uniref:Uncharacterized protein n=1 Tax=Pyronema omphalodes (strain CBS 100304) TaxID=1076935 RepID=U4L2B6_PYROM|nr:Protein of unknown function [Pyronema omphalodes CBS 100304]